MARKLEPREARQGRGGNRVLIILIVGLILAAIAWWGVELFGEGIDTEATIDAAEEVETDAGDAAPEPAD